MERSWMHGLEGRPHLGIDDGCPSAYEMAPSKGLHANQLCFDGTALPVYCHVNWASVVCLTGWA
ncbi:hypothetical protein ABID08_006039 [Rhizobium binae]|uniref:Transposase n=1 Tax=Rhizobium binae TaxID=1138190 RepID=A0ABV2MQC5_9HYPH